MNNHLRLVIGGHDMATDDLSIEYEQVNPLFNDNVESGSLPFTLSLDGNRVVLKNMEDINSDVKARDLEHKDCQVYADGVLIHSGELIVGEEQELVDQLEVSVNSYVRSLSELISDMNCQDVPIKDDIQIGECVGDVTPDYEFVATTKIIYDNTLIWKYKDGHERVDEKGKTAAWTDYRGEMGNNTRYEDHYSGGEIQFTTLGFSVPHVYKEAVGSHIITEKVGNQPVIERNLINTDTPYPDAKYCNARITYAHRKMDEDGSTSDNIDENNPLFTLEANRPASGICFYLLYFLDCLFGKKCLDLNYDNANLLTVEDMKRLAFYTTHCEYDTVRKYEGDEPDLANITAINAWLANRDDKDNIRTAVLSPPSTVSDEDKDLRALTVNPNRSGQELTGIWNQFEEPSQLIVPAHYEEGVYYPATVKDSGIVKVGEWIPVYTEYMKDMGGGAYWEKVYGIFPKKVTAIKSSYYSMSGNVTANIMKMMANSKNFPDTSVSSIMDSLWASFGIKFVFDAEQRKVTPYFIRDVLRNQDSPRILKGQIISINKVTEKTTGFRMRYAAESDPQDQSKNVRDGVRDYATAYDYLMSASPIDDTLTYEEILNTGSISNTTCYVDRTTGNAYRWKIDKDFSNSRKANLSLFEVGGYKGVEQGDCSKQNEDYIVDVTSNLEPVIFIDANAKNTEDQQSILAAFANVDMNNEKVPFEIEYAFGCMLLDMSMKATCNSKETYDPTSTDEGNSPLQTYDWGTSVAVMRGGGSDATIQYYDYNYDGFGNAKYRTVSGTYAMTSDSIDQWNNDYDYNASGSGIGDGERFSLKIRAYHTDPNTGEILCDEDETDPQTGKITRKVRSRGLFDTFMPELAHFVLERNVYRITMLCEAAELADIPNHWDARYQIGDLVGWINKFKTQITDEEGLKEVVIDFYSL